jgi:hypothetical protein
MLRKTNAKSRHQPASPDDYRRFAQESVLRCLKMPANRTRSRAVQIILARAWDKLADQAEEVRKRDRPPACEGSVAARAAPWPRAHAVGRTSVG